MELKTLLIGLVCFASTTCYGVDDYLQHKPVVIPTAKLALAEARAVVKIEIVNEIPLLRQLVVKDIEETADAGFTMANPDVTKFHPEAVHAIAVELRKKGYYVEWVKSINPGQMLLVIDWSKGE